MTKNTFLDWDPVANNNSDVGGVNIAEGCAPSGINNGMRTMMAQLRSGVDGKMVYVTKSANYTALGSDNGAYLRVTATATISLTAVATLAANWHLWIKADGGDVTIDPNGAELINGASTLVIRNGESALVISSGSAFFANVAPTGSPFSYSTKNANYTALDSDYGSTIRFTTASTLSFTTTANLRTSWRIEIWNDSNGILTIDPDSTDTINGAATFIMQPGQRMEVFKTGATTFQGALYADLYSGPQLQGYSFGLSLTTNATDAANDVDIAVGAAAADTSPYALMQLTSALTKRIDAAWAVGTNQGGLDTGSVANSTYYIWLIQRSDTGFVDALFSLSSTAPTMPTNYDRKRRIGTLVRVSASNVLGSFRNGIPINLSGTSSDVLDIPIGVNRVTIGVSNLQMSASASPLIQLGTTGGIVTTGYVGSVSRTSTAASMGYLAYTAGHGIFEANQAAGVAVYGTIVFTRVSGNVWNGNGSIHYGGSTYQISNISLPGVLDRVRLTTTAGTATLSGTASISWEF